MAFDYGSIDLGLKNPFKQFGRFAAVRGGIQAAIGFGMLVMASGIVKESPMKGWILVLMGAFILSVGLTSLVNGIVATLRYFVGRNHPTSLSRNFSQSENMTSQEEANEVAYTDQQLEEMLVGRKNGTFVEPKGFLARLLHSAIRNLLFLPYPVRNLSQNMFGAWVTTFVSLFSYGLIAFVSLAGFAGELGKQIFPIYSAVVMAYVFLTWHSVGSPINRQLEVKIASLGAMDLTKIVIKAMFIPILIGLIASWVIQQTGLSKDEINQYYEALPNLYALFYLLAIVVGSIFSSWIFYQLLKARLDLVNPVAEVSELRENWQESVHPHEIFINLDNLVMANRRYKEVPNRVYRELDPKLKEQIDQKGAFRGEMLQEVQPSVKPMNYSDQFYRFRQIALWMGNGLFIISTLVLVGFSMSLLNLHDHFNAQWFEQFELVGPNAEWMDWQTALMTSIHWFMIAFGLRAFARLLTNTAHVFFSEIQFESVLVYFRCEGTFTESRIATGTSIYDSTRSENTLVRSSITPWVIVSKVVSSTFAATGFKNLEHPRHVLELHKNDQLLDDIRSDVISFLKDRESIASITSARDLGNASQIHQLNEQTRAYQDSAPDTDNRISHDDAKAAGFLRQEDDLNSRD